MITNSPFIQLFMVILAGAIFLLYIKPTVSEIRVSQDQIATYEYELNRVNEVNDLLGQHSTTINALPLSNIQALERYLPTKIDEIAVMRDLESIVAETGVKLTTLEYIDESSNEAQNQLDTSENAGIIEQSNLQSHLFRLGVESTYQELKNLLSAIEVNNYQIKVKALEMVPDEEGVVSSDIELIVFSLADPQSGADTLSGQDQAE